jgi:hypothetical protein
MKKIVSLVGIGAMVLMLGLGSGMAQQSAPKETSSVPASTQMKSGVPTGVEKDKTLPAKPGAELKSEKGTPMSPAAGKATEKTAEVKATGTAKEAEKTVVPKPGVEVKPDQAAPQKSSAGPSTDKTTAAVKQATDAKSEKVATPKAALEKAPEKAEATKPPAKQ